MAWLSGDTEEPLPPGASDALAPPEPAVRREMLRLQLEAELSERTAEVESIVSDQAVSAAEAGDAATAQADVQAVEDADAATDALVESPEELQVGHGRAEVAPGEGDALGDTGAPTQQPSEPAAGS